jgi:hypothetical protein
LEGVHGLAGSGFSVDDHCLCVAELFFYIGDDNAGASYSCDHRCDDAPYSCGDSTRTSHTDATANVNPATHGTAYQSANPDGEAHTASNANATASSDAKANVNAKANAHAHALYAGDQRNACVFLINDETG